MRVIAATKQLADACKRLKGIAGGRHTNPIMQNLRIDAKKTEVLVSAYNLDQFGQIRLVEVETTKPGVALLDAALLSSILARATGETVEIDAKDTQAAVKSGRDKFTLNTADPDEYPKAPEIKPDAMATMELAAYIGASSDLSRFASVERGRYALNGLFIEPGRGCVEFAACDQRRLGYRRCPAKAEAVKYQIIQPTAASALARTLFDGQDGDVSLAFTESLMSAHAGDALMISRLVEGQYPDYRAVLPKDNDKAATFDKAELLAAVGRAKLLTAVESQAVRFEFSPGKLTLRSKSPSRGDACVEVDAEYDGPECITGYDPAYVEQVLSVFQGERVTLRVKDKDTGVLIDDGNKDAHFGLVMPINI